MLCLYLHRNTRRTHPRREVLLFDAFDVLHDDVDGFLLAHIAHVEHEVVVASVVAACSRKLACVSLASLVDLFYSLLGFILVESLLLHYAFDALFHRTLDEDFHSVGIVAEDVEARASCDDARTVFGKTLQEL